MGYKVVQSDVIKWANEYDGEPFHAMLCDPPYHLTSIVKRFGQVNSAPAKGDVYNRASRGFMGQQWDGGDIAFRPETWAALGQHLYPGGFGLAFASSRGWHRMACAIEDAGLIIHPSIFMFGWLYLCLSEDTEILTNEGWKSYHSLLPGSICLCYNVNNKSLAFMPIEDVYVYDHDDTAYSIQSDSTDQIVTRNHRCLVERDGDFVFRQAQTLNCQESVPILENLPELWDSVLCDGLGGVLQSEGLLQGVWSSNDRQESSFTRPKAQAQGGDNYLCRLWKTGIQACRLVTESGRVFLLKKMQRQNKGDSLGEKSSKVDRGTQAKGIRANEGGWQSSLEGWRNLLQEAWQLYWGQVREMPNRIFRNGPQGWLCYGASVNSSSTPGASFESVRGSASQQPQPNRQQAGESNAIFQQFSAQEIRSNWKPATTLATVTPTHYKGKVWCVRTPTGTFVARRNGHIFITGNSGFPKATRIDGQIDKAAGVDQESIGTKRAGFGKRNGVKDSEGGIFLNSLPEELKQVPVTKATSPLAQVWAGHRYGLQAMKPALEPIILFQRPYEGRPVGNITETGAGALWIDGGRIATDDDRIRPPGQAGGNATYNLSGRMELNENHPNGRWPSNLILVHHPACNGECHPDCAVRALDEQSGESVSSGGVNGGGLGDRVYGKFAKDIISESAGGYGDSGPASRVFHQADWSHEVAEQLASAAPLRYEPKASSAEREAGLGGFPLQDGSIGDRRPSGSMSQRVHKDTGRPDTVSRNPHPTVKSISLTKYLATLLLPPAAYAPRRILVPFSGVGSEMIGATLAGWEDVTGIERESAYVNIANPRLEWWSDWLRFGQDDPKAILKANDEPAQMFMFAA